MESRPHGKTGKIYDGNGAFNVSATDSTFTFLPQASKISDSHALIRINLKGVLKSMENGRTYSLANSQRFQVSKLNSSFRKLTHLARSKIEKWLLLLGVHGKHKVDTIHRRFCLFFVVVQCNPTRTYESEANKTVG